MKYESTLPGQDVTAKNTPDTTHSNAATGPFSETRVCCGEQCKQKTLEILIM